MASVFSQVNLITKMQIEKPLNILEGFVLTGGKSSRMGADKAFLRFGDETFLEHSVKTLTAICDNRVRIILNQNQSAAYFSTFDYVRDIFEERGALGGIHAALVNSKTEWTIILACDLPLVDAQTVDKLAKTAFPAPDSIAGVVPVQSDGRVQPLCALYRSALCLPELERLLQSQDTASVRDFLNLVPVIYVENKKTPDSKNSVFFNVNTPIDYEQLAERGFTKK